MKIRFLLDHYKSPYSGAESQLLKLITRLQQRGHQCSMTVLRPSDYLQQAPFVCAVSCLHLYKMLSITALRKLIGFARQCRADGVDVVHILLNDAAIFAPPILKLFGLKVVVSRLDMGFWYSRQNLLLLRLSRFFVDRVLANGEAVKQHVALKEGYALDQISVIYNGMESLDVSEIEAVDLQQQLGLPTDARVVGIVASLYPIKRHQDLIAAVARVRQHFPQLHMVAVGGGDASVYQGQIEAEAVQTSVHFVGAQSNPIAWIKAFDVACLCSESEGFSNALVEYLLCGKPVLASCTGGNPELVQEGVNGYLFEVADVDTLAQRLQELLTDSSCYRRLANAAAGSIDERFSLDYFTDAHLSLYRSLG